MDKPFGKKVVKYVKNHMNLELNSIKVGHSAHVFTLDHPNIPVHLQKVYGVTTSKVIRLEEDGTFETLNSVYVPVEDPRYG